MEKRITLRLPEEIHEQVAQAAKDDRRSLNAEIVRLLEEALANRALDKGATLKVK